MKKFSRLLLKGGSVVDPARKRPRRVDVLVENGAISRVARGIAARGVETIDCRGRHIMPGFLDLHCHLREPGNEDAGTIATETRAALAGGFTRVCAMPNTDPPVDTEAAVRYQLEKSWRAGRALVLPVGCCTKGRQGVELAEIGSMHAAGAVAVSDDGSWIADARVMRRVLEYCKAFDLPVLSHCELAGLDQGGANESAVSTRLGLAAKPDAGEAAAACRDMLLAELVGSRLHVCHVSCAKTVELVRWAKRRGAPVTAEACPHHFTLTDAALDGFNGNFKVNPPLRTEADRQAVLEGLADGTLDCIATDHAPHTRGSKEVEFDSAPAGMTGFETAFSLAYEQLVLAGRIELARLVALFTTEPARVLDIEPPRVEPGEDAELVILDLKARWTYSPDRVVSLSHNSPFIGRELHGRVLGGVLPGGRVWSEPELA